MVHECAGDPSVLTLESPLAQLYDRATVTIAANVADATHGETVTEVLGNGDGSQPNQSFKLKQAPALTYIRSTAPGGAESTLQIRVNDLLWHEAPTLFERTARERIFTRPSWPMMGRSRCVSATEFAARGCLRVRKT